MRTRTGLTISMALLVLLVPALALASGGGGGEGGGHGGAHGASLKEHGYYLVNFLVFLGLLYVLAGDKIKAAVRDRSRAVGKDILEAGAALDAAHGREDEAKVLLDEMPARVAEIQETFTADGARLAAAIQARTETEKQKIHRAAETTVEAERATMRRGLSRELAEMTLTQAETLIEGRRAGLNQDRLCEGFITGLRAVGKGE
jgi:F-type H+-transporting ATPase subunit b